MQPRTRRQKEVFDYIKQYVEKHGYEPSYQLIARHLKVASKAGIAKHIEALEAQGLLSRRRENGSFWLDLQPAPTIADAVCEIEWLETPRSVALIEKRSYARDGDIVAALAGNKSVVLKQFFRQGAYVELRPANEGYMTIKLPANKVEILGVYRGLIRPLI
jgi:repressor LexA